ncbi:MAG TPA: alpha/beta fold hydrolase [Spirochaetota bacterium]|nr:alpha/beta fold hydrolase [Spirochaetota bacterium]
MKNVVIPGFATKPFLFDGIKNRISDLEVLDLKEFTYDETKNLLDNLKKQGEKLNIIGWSLGSLFTLKWILENQDFVNSIFITGATSSFVERINYTNGIPSSVVEKMIRLIKAGKTKLVLNDFYNNCFFYVKKKDDIIKKLLSEEFEDIVLINGLSELLTTDLREKIKDINVKTMIYHGLNDKITPIYGAEFIHNNIKNSILIKVDCGHSYFLECEDDFVNRFKEFIND